MINAGPLQVYHVDGGLVPGTETAMPPTQGGVTMEFSFGTLETLADITGLVARDDYYNDMSLNVTVPYTDVTEASELLSLFPRVEDNAISLPVGCNARDDAIGLVLRPIICGEVSTDDDDAMWAPLVLPVPDFNPTFSMTEQVIWNVTYKVYPIDPRGHDFRMMFFGQVGT